MGPIFICLDHGKELCSPRANVSLCGFTCHPRTLKQKQLNNMNPPSRFQLVVNIYYFIISSSGLLQSTSIFLFCFFYFILMITMLICTHFWKWGTNGKQLSSWHAFPSHTEPSQPRSLIATAITQTSITLSWGKPQYPNGKIVHYIVCIPSTVFYCFITPSNTVKIIQILTQAEGVGDQSVDLNGIFISTQCFISKLNCINARFKGSGHYL